MHDGEPPSGDTLPPFGALDMPLSDQDVTDVVSVAGWVLDDVGIARVEILLDGTPVGTASYGIRRPDVATVYPYAAEQIGFSYPLDTRPYANGSHQVSVRAIDKAGNVAVLPGVTIVIHNGE